MCLRPIGILHYAYVDPLPEGLSYPYPDFLQIVYAGSEDGYNPECKEVDGYELGSEFVSVADARSRPLNAGQQVFLDSALRSSQSVVEKVVAYITKAKQLLVFRHVDSDAGIQVPAGTLKAGESPGVGVMREAREETGLDSLVVGRFLGTRDYDMSPCGIAEIHRRYYYQL